MSKLAILVTLLILLLQSCGSGEDSGSSNPPAPIIQLDPLPVKPTSYENFKEVGLTPQVLPDNRSGVSTIRAFGDFSRSGRLDLFTATHTYWPPTTPEAATPSVYQLWRKQANGTYINDISLSSSEDGCIHPRKAIVADFNSDSVPDIYVVCFGYDKSPFPGEKNQIVLSQSDGTFTIKNASDDVGTYHSGSAADLNNDGMIDVILTDNIDGESAFIYLNTGGGSFERETVGRLPSSIAWKNYFTVELVDVDGDSLIDVILGGYDWQRAHTIVLLNPGNNDFSKVTPVVLPAVPNEGIVLDFAITSDTGNRNIWILRTSGGDGTFYQSRVIQKVSWPNLNSTIPLVERPAQWLLSIIPATVAGEKVITSEDASVRVSVKQ